jgi:light-regulated signal transduction histidine kinase (bacteriophytochrome)
LVHPTYGGHIPQAASYSERCSGLLAVPVSRVPRDYIVLFRREFSRVVQWAGDPDAPKAVRPLGDRLTPRKSFAIWKEERRAQSRPWSLEDRSMAEGLRVSLLEVILQLVDSAANERAA